MSKRIKLLPQERDTILFNVVFGADGDLGGLDGDEPARELIEQQEAEIALKTGRPPRAIQSLTRAAKSELKPTWH